MGRPQTVDIKNISTRPNCINRGCNTPVTVSSYYKNGNAKWRPVCGTCAQAQTGKTPYADGVIPFRQNTCANKDLRLGFKCPTNFKLLPKGIFITEIDHINGNDADNSKKNIQELCVTCHKIKTRLSKDSVPNSRKRVNGLSKTRK